MSLRRALRAPGIARALGIAVAVLLVMGGAAFWGVNQVGSGRSPASSVLAEVEPGVVYISTTLTSQPSQELEQGVALTAWVCQQLYGTGIVLSSSGAVLTNNHLVQGAVSIRVRDAGDGRSYDAAVLGTDIQDDLALIQMQGASGLRSAALGDPGSLRVGAPVVALGNTGDNGLAPRVSAGNVTSLGGSVLMTNGVTGISLLLTGLIETTLRSQPGDSGGPLVGPDGKVVGLITAGKVTDSCSAGYGQGVAIPIDKAKAVADQMTEGRRSEKVHIGPTPSLGVVVASSSSLDIPGAASFLPLGALITRVVADSPAQRAGMGAGDVIVSLDGHTVGSSMTLIELLQQHVPGDRVQVGWIDKAGDRRLATVELMSGPPQ